MSLASIRVSVSAAAICQWPLTNKTEHLPGSVKWVSALPRGELWLPSHPDTTEQIVYWLLLIGECQGSPVHTPNEQTQRGIPRVDALSIQRHILSPDLSDVHMRLFKGRTKCYTPLFFTSILLRKHHVWGTTQNLEHSTALKKTSTGEGSLWISIRREVMTPVLSLSLPSFLFKVWMYKLEYSYWSAYCTDTVNTQNRGNRYSVK